MTQQAIDVDSSAAGDLVTIDGTNASIAMLRCDASSSSYVGNGIESICSRANISSYHLFRARSSGGSDTEWRVRGDGQIFADGNFNSGGADYAEVVDVAQTTDNYEGGDVMVVSGTDEFDLSTTSDDVKIAGVYSTNPVILGNMPNLEMHDPASGSVEVDATWVMVNTIDDTNQRKNGLEVDGDRTADYAVDSLMCIGNNALIVLAVSYDSGEDRTTVEYNDAQPDEFSTFDPKPLIRYGMSLRQAVPMAMMGRVLTKCITENGTISPGDMLVTSSTTGRAMKASSPTMGTVLGKALDTLTDTGSQDDTGTIMVYVNLM
jgi:hypothetical protein